MLLMSGKKVLHENDNYIVILRKFATKNEFYNAFGNPKWNEYRKLIFFPFI